MRQAAPTPAPFAARDGLLLVAAIHQPDSPNYDALLWTMNEVLPALASELGAAPMLHVIGYTTPKVDMSPFEAHPNITLHGSLGDLQSFYDSCRVFIAPTRFAAGTPYKVYETASYGLPCVATDILAGATRLARRPRTPHRAATRRPTLRRANRPAVQQQAALDRCAERTR